MQTANFITASAEVTSITKLKKGDVYKRLEESSYSDDKLVHGIVLDVLYNGQDAAIQAMEFKGSYNTLETEFKIFSGSKEIKIFPSSQTEVTAYLKSCVKSIEDGIERKQKELKDEQEKLTRAQEIVSGEIVKKLTTPEYASRVIEQDELIDLEKIDF